MDDLRRYRSAIAAEEIFVAYNANVDAIVHVDDTLAEALGPPSGNSTDQLDSPGDLSTAIASAMAAGEGNEISMTDEFATWLEDTIKPDERRLGGQAGISADVTASVGADPILYTYLLSEEQRSAFTTPDAIRYPLVNDGRLEYRPIDTVKNAERTKINWIFEFAEGETQFGVEATGDSRFIAAARPEQFNLETGPLADVIDQVGQDVDGAILAGYQSIPDQFTDGTTAVDHIPSARQFIERLRSVSDLPMQIEYAVTHNEELRKAINTRILPRVNAVGVDTPELHILAGDFGVPTSRGDIIDMYETAVDVLEAIGTDCLKIHATEYFMAVMDDYRPPADVRAGFDFAAMVAATKASTGRVRSPGDLRIGADCVVSSEGVTAVDRLADHLGVDQVENGIETESLVVQPNRVVQNPKSTVGIGDAVSATSFLLETALAGDE